MEQHQLGPAAGSPIEEIKRLVSMRFGETGLGADELALAILALCGTFDDAVNLAVDRATELADWLCDEVQFDALQLLKQWRESDNAGRERKLQEATHLIGDTKMDKEVPAVIAQATAAFLQQLPDLLREHKGQWVGYLGRQQIAIGPTKQAVFDSCVAAHCPPREVLIRKVQPDVPVAQVTW